MTALVLGLLALAALSLGLRATAVFAGGATHPLARFAAAAIVGSVITGAFLQLCDRYGMPQLAWGLLLSLSPVGMFDVAKWWFRWRK